MRLILCAIALSAVPAAGSAPARAGEDDGYRLLITERLTVRWRVPAHGLPARVTYAFVTAPITPSGERNCGAMLAPEAALAPSGITRAAFAREVREAFAMWQRAANIEFLETDDVSGAGILIGAQGQPTGRAFTNVSTQRPDGRASPWISQARICLNPNMRWKIGFDGNLDVYDLRYTIAHEIGHAIGLDHPGPAGQVMAYRYDERQSTLQPGDIAGAITLYGPRPAGGFAARTVPAATAAAKPRAAGGQAFGLGEAAPGKGR